MVGSELQLHALAVELLCECIQSALEVGECDLLVDYKTLALVEDRRMCAVHLIAAVNSAGADDGDRRLLLEHGSYLHRGCLGSQQDVVINIECIVRVSCGVSLKSVQHVEAVLGVLNLGTVYNSIAHSVEYGLEVVEYYVHRVALCNELTLSGHGNVDCLGL